MLVIADTSPLHYLVLIEQTAILPLLFGDIFVPPAVVEELQRPRMPATVRAWMESPPVWLTIRSPREPPVSTTMHLGMGEREVLSLAQELHADLVLLDDLEARTEGGRCGLAVMGTLRVLELAAERSVLDFPTEIAKLETRRETAMLMHNPLHPGEVLRDLCLEPLGLSVTAAAKALGVSRKTLSTLLNGHAGVSPEMAIRLSIAFETSAESWLRQQMAFNLWQAEQHRDALHVTKLAVA